MTTEVGVPGKNIIYLNIHHEGTTANETCSVNERWAHSLLENQSEYLVAISRFEVPMNKVPITRELKGAIEIYRYHDSLFNSEINDMDGDKPPYPTHIRVDAPATLDEMIAASITLNAGGAIDGQNWVTFPTHGDNDFNRIETLFDGTPLEKYNRLQQYLENVERIPSSKVQSIDIPPCHTLFEFLRTMNESIKEALLDGEHKPFSPSTIVAYNGITPASRIAVDDDEKEHTEHRHNVFSQNAKGKCDDTPIAYFYIQMSSDYRFSICMTSTFTRNYYVKLHPELFKMLQFPEQNLTGQGIEWDRTWLTGRRFMGDRHLGENNMPKYSQRPRDFTFKRYYVDNMTDAPPYSKLAEHNNYGIQEFFDLDRLDGLNVVESFQFTLDEDLVIFTSPTSAADSINRVKSIVFTSSLATKSEGQSGNTYRRILTDFTVPVDSTFSWNPNTGASSTISEGAAAELTYASDNPSSGRLLIMTDPSPLYELSLQVMAKCWNFETESFTFEPIPLPQGSTFTCKLVFISKNDIYHDHEQRPDKLKG